MPEAFAGPIPRDARGLSAGSRAERANSTISAATPRAQSAPMAVP